MRVFGQKFLQKCKKNTTEPLTKLDRRAGEFRNVRVFLKAFLAGLSPKLPQDMGRARREKDKEERINSQTHLGRSI